MNLWGATLHEAVREDAESRGDLEGARWRKSIVTHRAGNELLVLLETKAHPYSSLAA